VAGVASRSSGREPASRGPAAEGDWAAGQALSVLPSTGFGRIPARTDEPFVAGDIADRGPLERTGTATVGRDAAREARELQRQKAWSEQASRALNAMKAEDGTGPVNADDLEDDDLDRLPLGAEEGPTAGPSRARRRAAADPADPAPGHQPQALEQASATCSCPVMIAHDLDEADVVMTLRNEYKQKTPMLRDAEDRAMPIYVLKSNTIPQMQTSLTSIFSLEIDPREAALRETEDAIESVLASSEAVELSPQNATSAGSSTRWPNGPTSCPARAVVSRIAGSASTRTRRAAAGGEPPLDLDFLGHSAVVIDLDGVRLLTDPVTRARSGHCDGSSRSRPGSGRAAWTPC
jgi:hypothetical protein